MNRRSFEAAVDREIASGTLPGERGAMVIVDLDHLKRVNDTLGRSTGDRVVADIAKMIAEELGSATSSSPGSTATSTAFSSPASARPRRSSAPAASSR